MVILSLKRENKQSPHCSHINIKLPLLLVSLLLQGASLGSSVCLVALMCTCIICMCRKDTKGPSAKDPPPKLSTYTGGCY